MGARPPGSQYPRNYSTGAPGAFSLLSGLGAKESTTSALVVSLF